jgi:hypothetical protein
MKGFIKLHRSLMQKGSTFQQLTALQQIVFIYIILSCNHADATWVDKRRGLAVIVKRGQVILSRRTILGSFPDDPDLTERKARTALERLEKVGLISRQVPPHQQFTVVTALNYEKYQSTQPENKLGPRKSRNSTKSVQVNVQAENRPVEAVKATNLCC